LIFLALAFVLCPNLFVYVGFSSTLPIWGFSVFFLGIFWFFSVGEWYKKRPSDKKKDTDRWLTVLLIIGLLMLVAASILEWKGNAYYASWPSMSTAALLGIGLLATLIGLSISYIANRIATDRSL
jgi:uncharacterized membrane protein